MKNQFIDIGQVELFPDAGAIDMNGLETHIHLLGNLARVEATPQQLKHLEFAIAQGRDGRRLVAGSLDEFFAPAWR